MDSQGSRDGSERGAPFLSSRPCERRNTVRSSRASPAADEPLTLERAPRTDT